MPRCISQCIRSTWAVSLEVETFKCYTTVYYLLYVVRHIHYRAIYTPWHDRTFDDAIDDTPALKLA